MEQNHLQPQIQNTIRKPTPPASGFHYHLRILKKMIKIVYQTPLLGV
jgi:hypothetical protein